MYYEGRSFQNKKYYKYDPKDEISIILKKRCNDIVNKTTVSSGASIITRGYYNTLGQITVTVDCYGNSYQKNIYDDT